ncbi:MAG: ABC transporter ATP-binding protein/permease [Firmicutes bacterium]|nr:ABC transporter ATP-binding protein/permease [Bacillota bacterium]
MIRLNNVNKYYNRKKSNEIHVINDTSLVLEEKGLVTFLGPSGCGKTTLLNAIGGLDKVHSGEIWLDDDKITCKSNNRKDEIRNASVGYIFQNYNLLEDATVFENVALVLKMMGVRDKSEIEERVMFVLERVGIDRYKNRPAKMLSGGERQRVGIARAIVKNPKIIIADEPTGNLDSKNTIEIMNIIKAISREKLVILVTHEREIAEFYASRIIEILDGRIVSDRANDEQGLLDYRLEHKVYLKDMPVQKELVSDGIRIRYFSDREEDAENLEVKVVIKNNHLYVELPDTISEGSQAVELVDDHYKQMSKEDYEDYEFNYAEIKGRGKGGRIKYTSIFNPVTLIIGGYKKVFSYSVIKKILLAGFVMASMFTMYAISNVAGITNITDEEFVTVNKQYLTVETGAVKADTYEKYRKMDGIDYVMPGDSRVSFIMPLDDYYQSVGASTMLEGSLAARSLIDKDAMVTGRIPTGKRGLVVDKIIVDQMLKGNMAQQIGIDTYEEFIGRTVKLDALGDFVIRGITDQGSPSIYGAKSLLLSILQCQPEDGAEDAMTMNEALENTATNVTDYNLVKGKGDITIEYGDAPDALYEALVSLDRQYEVAIGSTLDTKVNGKNLVVCGFYTSRRGGGDKVYVSSKTALYNFFGTQKHLTICPEDKDAAFAQLSEAGVKVKDPYADSKKAYIDSIKKQVLATIWVAVILLLVSLIEMYLMLRASFLSRIKEVGVLRAIGLKKKDVYKMFLGEIIALFTLTAIPGMTVMAYILNELTKMPFIGDTLMMNPLIFGICFVLILGFDILAGLIPVFRTMRKTPAEILARNDVN